MTTLFQLIHALLAVLNSWVTVFDARGKRN
jgi:hypothetical protein